MSLFKWSKTAATNATADSSINYQEGQAPSSLNDSARAAMAAVAKYRDDINGTIATGGTSTAFTVTSNQSFDTLAHMDGAMIAFVPHATSGATPTLNIDGLGAKAIRMQTSIGMPEGVLVAGTPYVVTYFNAATEFLLHNIAGDPYGIPVGGMMPYASANLPNSCFVFPYGQAISRTTYSVLYNRTGTAYGAGDGSTTFNIPNLTARVVFCLDAMNGTPSGVVTSTYYGANPAVIGALGGAQSKTLAISEIPSHDHGTNTGNDTPDHTHAVTVQSVSGLAGSGSGVSVIIPGAVGTTSSGANSRHTHSIAAQGGGAAFATLPPGIALPYIMRII